MCVMWFDFTEHLLLTESEISRYLIDCISSDLMYELVPMWTNRTGLCVWDPQISGRSYT